MSARDDYPIVEFAVTGEPHVMTWKPRYDAAMDEIDRLRADRATWINAAATSQMGIVVLEADLLVLRTALVKARAAEIYKPEGVEIWFNATNKLLDGESPKTLIERGELDRVLGLIDALADGIAT